MSANLTHVPYPSQQGFAGEIPASRYLPTKHDQNPHGYNSNGHFSSGRFQRSPDLLRAAIYGCLLHDCLSLSAADARAIEKLYELNAEHAFKVGIRTTPTTVEKLFAASEVNKKFACATWPAGLFKDFSRLELNTPPHGLIVPARRQGLLRALLHYKHPADPSPRWITSKGLPDGSKAAASIHVVGAEYVKRSPVAILANDSLRAEAIGYRGILTVVGLNNVTPSLAIGQLRETLPELRAVLIQIESFDDSLIQALRKAGLRLEVSHE